MTLVAGLSFGGTPAFVGDLLTSWRVPAEIDLPTRHESELLKGIDGHYAGGLTQKLLIVRPYLLIAWAGEVSVIHSLVRELDSVLPLTLDELYGREDEIFKRLDRLPPTVEVLAVLIHGENIWPFCVYTRGFEIDGKRIYLLGTGNQTAFDFLSEMTKGMPMPDNSDGIAARSVLINFAANALMAQFQSGYGLSESWGGGFEIAYVTKQGFSKVDNILVRCWSLNDDGSLGNIGRSFLVHYQESSLLLSSFGDQERTTVIRSPIDKKIVPLPTKEICPNWTVDLFWRPEDNRFFHAVQMEYPWSKNNSRFHFKNGNIVSWTMEKSRVEKIVDKIRQGGPHPLFQTYAM